MTAVQTPSESTVSSTEAKRRIRNTGFRALFQKELADHLNSTRFYLVFGILLITSTAALLSAAGTLKDSGVTSSEFLFLKLFTTSGRYIYSFATWIAFLGPLIGIALGFDAISSERTQGTLNRLAAQPIYRDSIINAKFLAGAAAIFLIAITLSLYMTGGGLLLLGVVPSFEEILRILFFTVLTGVYLSVWLAASIIFSVICRHGATAALSCIGIWLFLSMFMGTVAGGVANLIYPIDGIEGFANMMSNYELELALNRISPYYLFNEAATTILNPSVRSIGIVTMESYSGAVSGYLSLEQSLLLVWPHLVVMAALVIAGFAAAYISFMRQEIRA